MLVSYCSCIDPAPDVSFIGELPDPHGCWWPRPCMAAISICSTRLGPQLFGVLDGMLVGKLGFALGTGFFLQPVHRYSWCGAAWQAFVCGCGDVGWPDATAS
jgi:hypothetical protein